MELENYNNLYTKSQSTASTLEETSPKDTQETVFDKENVKPQQDAKAAILESLKSLPFKNPIFTIIRNPVSNASMENSKALLNYNRKEKSLGELSKKFLMMFGRIEKCVISLETVTQELGVERRRIYDIINILESLGVVFRKGKNNYQWNGLKSIHSTINKIEKECSLMGDHRDNQDYDDSDDEDSSLSGKPSKKEKSLGLLSNGYIRLFFTWKSIISLEQAAKKLSSEKIEENKIKTKIRRLYDIANVFSALGLIKKTCLEESRKPAFQWIGLNGLDRFIKRLHASQDEKEIFEEKISIARVHEKLHSVEKPKLKKQPSLNIQSEHSAFKVRESPNHNQNGMLENLLGLLLDICKRELNKNEGSQEKPKTRIMTENNDSLRKKIDFSPKTSENSKEYVTPYIRKSVSIIQTIDYETDLTPHKLKKENSIERPALQERGLNQDYVKRPASYKLDEFEPKTIRKGFIFKENPNMEYTIKKALEFRGKENSNENIKLNAEAN